MSRDSRHSLLFVLFCLTVALSVRPATATYHTYRIAEVYSNPSGTVQYIEMQEDFGFNSQNLETLAPDVRSGAHAFIFPTNLPSANTANTFFLLGTPGYNSITGAPHADYTIPSNFLNPSGDTIQYGSTGPDGVVDLITFSALPNNPTQALFRQGTSGSTFTTAQAIANTFSSGGNFAVPEPASLGTIGLATLALMRRRRRATTASTRIAKRRR